MKSPGDDNSVQQNNHERSPDERVEAALLLLKGLNPLQEKSDEEGFDFLSYLLRMAVLEAQAIASMSASEPDRLPRDVADSSYEVSPPGEVDDTI